MLFAGAPATTLSNQGAPATTLSNQGAPATTMSNQGAPATTLSNQGAQAKPTSNLDAHAKTLSNQGAQATTLSNQGAQVKTTKLRDSAGNNITAEETCKILGFKWRDVPVFNDLLKQSNTEIPAGVPSLLSKECRVESLKCGFYAICVFVCFCACLCVFKHVFV